MSRRCVNVILDFCWRRAYDSLPISRMDDALQVSKLEVRHLKTSINFYGLIGCVPCGTLDTRSRIVIEDSGHTRTPSVSPGRAPLDSVDTVVQQPPHLLKCALYSDVHCDWSLFLGGAQGHHNLSNGRLTKLLDV